MVLHASTATKTAQLMGRLEHMISSLSLSLSLSGVTQHCSTWLTVWMLSSEALPSLSRSHIRGGVCVCAHLQLLRRHFISYLLGNFSALFLWLALTEMNQFVWSNVTARLWLEVLLNTKVCNMIALFPGWVCFLKLTRERRNSLKFQVA